MPFLSNLFGSKKGRKLMLVVALNKVDAMLPNSWNTKLNLPNDEAERQIERKCKDIIKKLSIECDISTDNFIYYSAEKRYNLIKLLSKVVEFGKRGWILNSANPGHFIELVEDEEVKDFIKEQMAQKGKSVPSVGSALEKLILQFKEILSTEEFEEVQHKMKEEEAIAPKIVIIGKAGAGKTTTVNHLFNATFKTSSTLVGTHDAQQKEFELEKGGKLIITDLPGYGRSLEEDERYMEIYQETIPESDIVLLVIDASQGDYIDDIEMLKSIKIWLKQQN
ncbi:GTPase [Haliscomenobacter sp.]|uniref:GTPase n=1 Tax=Haliscomenobacter sp. TaxID=2717303 RepID=UPI003BAC9BA2